MLGLSTSKYLPMALLIESSLPIPEITLQPIAIDPETLIPEGVFFLFQNSIDISVAVYHSCLGASLEPRGSSCTQAAL